MLKQVKREMKIHTINIAAIQEIRWRGSAVSDTGNFT
jgi:hypothetical protein